MPVPGRVPARRAALAPSSWLVAGLGSRDVSGGARRPASSHAGALGRAPAHPSPPLLPDEGSSPVMRRLAPARCSLGRISAAAGTPHRARRPLLLDKRAPPPGESSRPLGTNLRRPPRQPRRALHWFAVAVVRGRSDHHARGSSNAQVSSAWTRCLCACGRRSFWPRGGHVPRVGVGAGRTESR